MLKSEIRFNYQTFWFKTSLKDFRRKKINLLFPKKRVNVASQLRKIKVRVNFKWRPSIHKISASENCFTNTLRNNIISFGLESQSKSTVNNAVSEISQFSVLSSTVSDLMENAGALINAVKEMFNAEFWWSAVSRTLKFLTL